MNDCVVEEVICRNCNGSGEGMYDGTKCRFCKGSGVEYVEAEKEKRNESK